MDEDRQRLDRRATIDTYGLMEVIADPRFDAIIHEAALAAGTPDAMIAILDDQRYWRRAHTGAAHDFGPVTEAICAQTIRGDDIMVVPDTALDARFMDLPIVTGAPGVRFYAGRPLALADGVRVGTLCVTDTVPRVGLSEHEATALEIIAQRVVAAIETDRDTAGSDTAEDWLDRACTYMAKASVALERIDAQLPLAHLEQAVMLANALRRAPIDAPSPPISGDCRSGAMRR